MAHFIFHGLTQNLKVAKLELYASKYFLKYNVIENHKLIRFASSNQEKGDRQGTSKALCKKIPYKCEVIVFNTVTKSRPKYSSASNKSTPGCTEVPKKAFNVQDKPKECPRTSSRQCNDAPNREYEQVERSANLAHDDMSNRNNERLQRTSCRDWVSAYEHMESSVKKDKEECAKMKTINALDRSKKIDEMTPFWYIQRTVSTSLALLVPAALANPCPTLDLFLASALVMHNYWSLEALCEEYVKQSKFAVMPPGVVPVVLLILSGLTLAGLLSLIYNDVGIAQAFLCLWKLREHDVECCPPTKKAGIW